MPLLHSPEEIRALLERARTIAVVGLSSDPDRDSHRVGAYLQSSGYRVIPVNPHTGETLGARSFARLEDLPLEDLRAVDIVNVFRRPEAAAEVARTSARLGLKAIWFQLGVATPEAIEAAEGTGMAVVAGSCIEVAHRLLLP